MCTSATRAIDLLNAWQEKDLVRFRAELKRPDGPSAGSEEEERMDLLRGIADKMQRDFRGDHTVCLRLLEHLAASGNHPAIRPRKLAFFPN